MQTLLEPRDAERILGLTSAGVRVVVDRGPLQPVAVTPRGVRLFREADVQALRRAREASAERRSTRG
jgi:hypothetical protein